MPARLDAAEAGFADRFAAALAARREDNAAAGREAAEIVAAVRSRGDAALLEYTARFDGPCRDVEELRVAPAAARRGARGARRRDRGGAGACRGTHRGLSPRTEAA